MDRGNGDYSWLSKSINDINRSYLIFKLRNETGAGAHKAQPSIFELLDAHHHLIMKIDDYIHKPRYNENASVSERNSSMLLRSKYALFNHNYSFGNNEHSNMQRREVFKEKPSRSTKMIKIKRRQLSSGLEVGSYINKPKLNCASLIQPKVPSTAHYTYTDKERIKRTNYYPFRAITHSVKENKKSNK